MGDGSTFDDAPQQSEFGYNSEGSVWNDAEAAGWKAYDQFPGWKQGKAAFEYWDKVGPQVGRLFEGEATFDDLFTIIDESLNMAVNVIEGIELALVPINTVVGGPGAVLGLAVSTLVSVGLTFVTEVFQPIQDLFGMLTGNPDRIRVSRDMWVALQEGITPVGDDLMGLSDKLGEVWQDDGADAARARLLEGNDVIQVAGALAMGVASALEFCAKTFEKVEGFLINRASDIAGLLVSGVPRAMAGPLELALFVLDMILMATRIQLELAQLAMYLGRAFGALISLMNGAEAAAEKMGPYIDGMSAAA